MKEYQKALQLKQEVEKLLEESDSLLKSSEMKTSDLEGYKRRCRKTLEDILSTDSNDLLNELAKSAFDLKVKRYDNLILKVINTLLNVKIARSFSAPYLIRYKESDYAKKYVHFMQFKLKGILYNLNLLEND